tara:strand:- start:757 stop:2220 length:1464 start_codon:yes stop_codon:yes gene_type:complete
LNYTYQRNKYLNIFHPFTQNMIVKKVLLINPNYQREISSLSQISVGPPLGLAYIAAMLRKDNIKVKIIDSNAENIGIENILLRVKNEDPDLIGLTSVTPTIKLCCQLSSEIKKILPDVPIVVGGVHPSLAPNETLKDNPNIDFLIIGEGEYTFPDLIKSLNEKSDLKKVDGLVWKKDRVIVNKKREFINDLDKLPFPARDLLPNEKYKSIEFDNFTTIIAMRGCPASCIYCAVPSFCGKELRKRGVKNVIEEIEDCIQNYGVKSFSFLDDTFTYDVKWVEEFCNKMEEKSLNKKVKWLCLTRVDTISLPLLKKMKSAGCYKIELGIESGSPRILKEIGKGITVEQIKEGFEVAKKAGMVTMAFAMVGFPFETEKDILMTKDLIKETDPSFLQVSYATPYPGTSFYEYCKKNNLLATNNYSKYIFLNNSLVLNENGISTKQITKSKRDLERSFYLRFNYMVKSFFYLLKTSENLSLFLNRSLTFLRRI